jgi:plastocyanin
MNKKTTIIALIAIIAIVLTISLVKKSNAPIIQINPNANDAGAPDMGVLPEAPSSGSVSTDQSELTTTLVAVPVDIAIKNFAYDPGSLIVKKGTTVTWTNEDSVSHTVTASGTRGPSSPTLGKGETYSYTFDTPGRYDYSCMIHPSMHGTVTVTQ